MKRKTNKKRGDRYMGHGHSRSSGGSKGGSGRAGYKKHKKTLKIFQSKIKVRNYKKYVKGTWAIKKNLCDKLFYVTDEGILKSYKNVKILDKKELIEYYAKRGIKLSKV